MVFGGGRCGRQQPDGLFTVVVGLDMEEPAVPFGGVTTHRMIRAESLLLDVQDLLEVADRVAEGAVIRLGKRQGDAVVLAGLQRVRMIGPTAGAAKIRRKPAIG